MSSEATEELGPRIEPEPPETVQNILEDAPEAAQANMERAEAILGALDESDVPDKYDTEGQWGFAFTGALAQHPETFKIWWAEEAPQSKTWTQNGLLSRLISMPARTNYPTTSGSASSSPGKASKPRVT